MRELDAGSASRAPMCSVKGTHRQGNTRALEEVFKVNGELIRRICLRMLRDPIEAEDAAQDVFVHVLRKLHTFRGDSALSSWLYRLTTNLVLMRFRKNRHKNYSLRGLLEDDGELLGILAKPDLYLQGVIDRVDIQAAIDMLPRGYKTVFILHDIQGYAHKEIAELLGYSVGNSKSQLHKAHRHLRKLLGGRPSEGVRQEEKLKSVRFTPRLNPQWLRHSYADHDGVRRAAP